MRSPGSPAKPSSQKNTATSPLKKKLPNSSHWTLSAISMKRNTTSSCEVPNACLASNPIGPSVHRSPKSSPNSAPPKPPPPPTAIPLTNPNQFPDPPIGSNQNSKFKNSSYVRHLFSETQPLSR